MLLSIQFCLCLCETTVIVGWMTALCVLQVSIHSDIYSWVAVYWPVLAKCVLNYFPSFCGLSHMHNQF